LERKKNLVSFDYFKYLNGMDSYRMTYDQWKEKNTWEDPDKCGRCGNNKDHFNICPKCKY
jgi:hypothetical protein